MSSGMRSPACLIAFSAPIAVKSLREDGRGPLLQAQELGHARESHFLGRVSRHLIASTTADNQALIERQAMFIQRFLVPLEPSQSKALCQRNSNETDALVT